MYYAYGIRNSFGIAFDPLTGNLWDTENGPSFGDEINLVEPGFNSGWAKVLGIWNIEEAVNEEGEREILKGEVIPENINDILFNFNGSGKYQLSGAYLGSNNCTDIYSLFELKQFRKSV